MDINRKIKIMDLNRKIIKEVKKYECIYNIHSDRYRHFEYKEKLWREIGKECRISAEDARKKWTNVRDYYLKRKRVDPFTRPYKYSEDLRFLDNFPSASRGNLIFKTEDTFYEDETDTAVNNLNQQQEQTDQEQDQDQHFDVLFTEQEVSNEADFEIENFDLNDYVKKIDHPTTTINATNTTTTNNNPTKNTSQEQDLIRRKKYDKEALIQDACQEMTSLLQNAKKHFTPPSSNQVFFNSIALQVEEAQLPALTQMRLQQRILEMVTLEIVNHQQNTIQQL